MLSGHFGKNQNHQSVQKGSEKESIEKMNAERNCLAKTILLENPEKSFAKMWRVYFVFLRK